MECKFLEERNVLLIILEWMLENYNLLEVNNNIHEKI